MYFSKDNCVEMMGSESSNIDYAIPEPMTDAQIIQMRELIADEAYKGAFHVSINLCAMYVRKAIERAHKKLTGRTMKLIQKPCAYDYGESLLYSGFRIIPDATQKGDIAIYQVTKTSPYGHIQVFTGESWISDYRQPSKFPDYSYHDAIPVYYRFYGIKK